MVVSWSQKNAVESNVTINWKARQGSTQVQEGVHAYFFGITQSAGLHNLPEAGTFCVYRFWTHTAQQLRFIHVLGMSEGMLLPAERPASGAKQELMLECVHNHEAPHLSKWQS